MSKVRHNQGFIALTASLMITIVLVILVVDANASTYFARLDALGSEFKRKSLALSESCVEAAFLKLAKNFCYDIVSDPDFQVGKGVRVNVESNHCYIHSITFDSACNVEKRVATIHTNAIYPTSNGSWSENEVVVTIQNPMFLPKSLSEGFISVISWK